MVSHGNPESELNIANAELERLVMEAYQQRKRVLDPTRRQELKNSIWRQRIKVAELEQNYAGHLLVQAQRDIEKAAISQDQEGYTEAYRRLVRLRIRYLNATDLLEKLRADGPDSSARLISG